MFYASLLFEGILHLHVSSQCQYFSAGSFSLIFIKFNLSSFQFPSCNCRILFCLLPSRTSLSSFRMKLMCRLQQRPVLEVCHPWWILLASTFLQGHTQLHQVERGNCWLLYLLLRKSSLSWAKKRSWQLHSVIVDPGNAKGERGSCWVFPRHWMIADWNSVYVPQG